MHPCRPIRGPRLSLTTCGMCRSAHPSCNSRSLCRYKTASHLHIPHPLKVPQFQRFAPKSHLTPFVCADARMGGGGLPGGAPARNPLTVSTVVSAAYTLPICNLRVFSRLRTPGGGGGVINGPGRSLTLWTGRIPDTVNQCQARANGAHAVGNGYAVRRPGRLRLRRPCCTLWHPCHKCVELVLPKEYQSAGRRDSRSRAWSFRFSDARNSQSACFVRHGFVRAAAALNQSEA